MRPITRYEADDGSIWDTEEEALARDHLGAVVAEAMAPLGPRDVRPLGSFLLGNGFLRHDPAVVAEVRRQVRGIRDRLVEFRHGDPVVVALLRLDCIDGQGREWGAPDYAAYPDQANAFEIPRP